MRYIPLTDVDRKAMLREIGSPNVDALFKSVPKTVRLSSPPAIPRPKTEAELQTWFSQVAARNRATRAQGWKSFLGAGCYEHFVPAVVDSLSSRSEFLTAYTPYQPEVSQGTLQSIFEFQSMIAQLFGLDVANASMYDGASATAEALLMALRTQKGKRIAISEGLHPEYFKVIESYLAETDAEISKLPLDPSGRTNFQKIPKDELAAVVVQQPNFFGVVEDLQPGAKAAHEKQGLMVVATTEPLAFGLLKDPGAMGADLVAGEGQPLGNYPNYGGPHLGLLAARTGQVRQMPGRIVGRTVDTEGRGAYVLTLATREQHIRRERATSNICTNHSLCALRACIYMATMGREGLAQLARRNATLGHQLKKKMLELKGVEAPYSGPIFNEFLLKLPLSAESFLSGMEQENILAGVSLSPWFTGRENELLLAITEVSSEEEIDQFVTAAKRFL